ncbi:MAG: FAD:protein FMN transferase [Anaerolineae bacterium]|nr:FAD:protein FMN transferase [Anaerolineae bacterium]
MTRFTVAFRAMGCQVNIWLETDQDGQRLLQAVPAEVEAIEAVLSRFRPESELSRLNQQPGQWVEVSETLLANILAAKQGARITNGLYHPLLLDALVAAGYDRSFEQVESSEESISIPQVTDWQEIQVNIAQRKVCIPAPIDVGGVAKGWTAEQIAKRLSVYGACLVDIGGDMAARGTLEESAGWEVAVAEPGGREGDIVHVVVHNASIVTSGKDFRHWQRAGQNHHHIIDPRTGKSAETDVVAVTVMHPYAPTAEVYAKAVMLLGSQDGLAWINQQPNASALAVCDDGSVLATHAFELCFVQ